MAREASLEVSAVAGAYEGQAACVHGACGAGAVGADAASDANGKIDRKALPAPQGRPEIAEYIEPRSEVERTLARIWREVLRLDRVGIHDDFFDLGGHSLLAMRVVAQVREALQIELAVRAVIEAPTLIELAAHVDGLRGTSGSGLLPSLVG